MTTTRLRWSGNREAQRQSDAAYSELKPNVQNKKSTKRFSSKKQRRKRRRDRSNQSPEELKNLAHNDYRKYLFTWHWKKLRREALKFYGRSCSICKKTTGLNVHHRHYRTVGCEQMVDLELLCTGCHSNHHEGSVYGCYDPLTVEYLSRFSV